MRQRQREREARRAAAAAAASAVKAEPVCNGSPDTTVATAPAGAQEQAQASHQGTHVKTEPGAETSQGIGTGAEGPVRKSATGTAATPHGGPAGTSVPDSAGPTAVDAPARPSELGITPATAASAAAVAPSVTAPLDAAAPMDNGAMPSADVKPVMDSDAALGVTAEKTASASAAAHSSIGSGDGNTAAEHLGDEDHQKSQDHRSVAPGAPHGATTAAEARSLLASQPAAAPDDALGAPAPEQSAAATPGTTADIGATVAMGASVGNNAASGATAEDDVAVDVGEGVLLPAVKRDHSPSGKGCHHA